MPASSVNKFSRPLEWLAAALVSGIVVWLHVYFWQHAGGLWRDEVNLVNLAHSSSLAAMTHDSFPILMPLLVKLWTAPGGTDAWLRLLGLLIGLGLPAALWLAAWRFHRAPPLPGLALLALNGTVIVFGDSLRAHGLGSLLILLAAVTAGGLLEKPSWRRTAGWAALAILSVQTLFQNAVFVAAICAGAWVVCARQKNSHAALQIFLGGLAAAVSLLPYWSNFTALNAGAGSLRIGIDPGRLMATFDTAFGFPIEQCRWLWLIFALALFLPGVAAFFFRRKIAGALVPGENFLPARWTTLLAALIAATGFIWFAAAPAHRGWIFLLLAVAVAWLEGSRRPLAELKTAAPAAARDRTGDLPLFAGTTLFLAATGFAAFLSYAALPTEQWYFFPLMALAAGCFEIGLPPRGHLRAAVWGFSGVTVALACVVIFSEHKAINWRFTNLDLLCPRLTAAAGPDDLVIVSPWYCGISFQRYFHGTAPWQTAPPLPDHSFARYDLVHEEMRQPHVVQPLIAQAEAALRAGHSVWLVGMMSLPTPGAPPPPDLPPPPLLHSGWSDRPYTEVWVSQINQALGDHCREFKLVYETTAENVNFMENVQLYRVVGWHD